MVCVQSLPIFKFVIDVISVGFGDMAFRNEQDVYFSEEGIQGGNNSLPSSASPYLLQERALSSPMSEASVGKVRQWYIQRSREIDDVSGQLENSLSLIELGIKHGMAGLEIVRNDLIILSNLVYEDMDKKQQPSTNQFITLDYFESLSNYERMCLLLDDSTDETIIYNLKQRALPFLDRLEASQDEQQEDLLTRWLVDMAMGPHFNWCTYVAQVFFTTSSFYPHNTETVRIR